MATECEQMATEELEVDRDAEWSSFEEEELTTFWRLLIDWTRADEQELEVVEVEAVATADDDVTGVLVGGMEWCKCIMFSLASNNWLLYTRTKHNRVSLWEKKEVKAMALKNLKAWFI